MNQVVSATKSTSLLQSVNQFMGAPRALPTGTRLCRHCGSAVLHVEVTFFLLGNDLAGYDLLRNATAWNR